MTAPSIPTATLSSTTSTRRSLRRIHVHHYPPSTSKWNKIEHRLFCHITQNWRGRPLTDRLAVVELIEATTTKTGLKVESAKGIKISKVAMKCLDITGDQFHPEWNYTIKPRKPAESPPVWAESAASTSPHSSSVKSP
jgi:hypothetical protein